jgi:hypothetical protein
MTGFRLRGLWLALVTVGAIALSVPAVASAAFTGGNGRIAYIDDPGHVVTVSSTGGSDRILTGRRAGVEFAAYRPDGREIVFDPAPGWESEGGPLYIMRAGGRGRARRITRAFDSRGRIGADREANWSPDGQSVVFTRDYQFRVGEDWEVSAPPSGPCAGARVCIRVYHRGRSRPLLPGASEPVWSTRGWIAFRDFHDSISVIRPDGSGERRLARDYGLFGFDWSPEGRRLVYVDSKERLSLVGADGRHVRRLGRDGWNPVFAPNGRSIVYEDDFKLYTTDLRGRHRHGLRSRYPLSELMDWQPLPRRTHR